MELIIIKIRGIFKVYQGTMKINGMDYYIFIVTELNKIKDVVVHTLNVSTGKMERTDGPVKQLITDKFETEYIKEAI